MSKKNNSGYTCKKQQGIVLVISLIILLLLSLLGITSTQNTGLEEKMAGNTHDKAIAFQAAEAALQAAEQAVDEQSTTTFLDCEPNLPNDGLSRENLPVEDKDFWLTATDVKLVAPIGTSLLAKYVIQCLSQGLYRITVYAQGKTADAVVILQSIYNANPNGVGA
jgi:type IV pilus assembly protein PilX